MGQTKIPKVIHYCWFGKKPLPKLARKCIQSWLRVLPDYQINLWNEENFDVNINRYAKEAYMAKKYAFVADFVRLYVLYNYGGIYLDTDVEVLKSLDRFLEHAAFSGYEDNEHIPTGIMGAQKGHEWIEQLLRYYDNKAFVKDDGSYDTTTNVIIITDITKKLGFIPNGKYQKLSEIGVHIYPTDYFCPKSYKTNSLKLTANTYCIHHFAGSWLTWQERLKNEIRQNGRRLLGDNIYEKIKTLKNMLLAGGRL